MRKETEGFRQIFVKYVEQLGWEQVRGAYQGLSACFCHIWDGKNHWQWEREENTYTVCRRNGQIRVFFQGKRVHLSRPVRQRVNISWYLESVRGARWKILQNKVPISTKKETKTRGLFVPSDPQNIASAMATGDAKSWASLHNQNQAPWADSHFTPASSLQPGLKGCNIFFSLGPKNMSYFIFPNKRVSTICYCICLRLNISVTEKYHSL